MGPTVDSRDHRGHRQKVDLPECAFFHRPCGLLLLPVVVLFKPAESLVGGTGPNRGHRSSSAVRTVERSRSGVLRSDPDVRGNRLGDVFTAALVFDDLWNVVGG